MDSKSHRIYIVFKTHFDIGFTDLSKTVIKDYSQTMLPSVIDTCKGTQELGTDYEYKWTMSAWPLSTALSSPLTEFSDKKEAEELIQRGQIRWHALPFTVHTEFCGMEDLIRGIDISNDLTHRFGFRPISAKMTDVPGHTHILPSILYAAGVRFLHLGCNPACISPNVPRLFWWEGPDGNRILTFYSKGCYGTDLQPPEDWPYEPWLALLQTNDNLGPQTADTVRALLAQAQEEVPNAQVKIGTLDDFYFDLIQQPLDIPVIRKDLADTWIHGIGSYPNEVKQVRDTRVSISASETLHSLLSTHGKDRSSSSFDQISQAYENLLLFDEHTWGLNVKIFLLDRNYEKQKFLKDKASEPYRLIEESWDEQRSRSNTANNLTNSTLSDGLASLTKSISVNGPHLLVYFYKGVSESGWYSIGQKPMALLDTRTGEGVPVRYSGSSWEAYIKAPPACGYLCLQILNQDIPTEIPDFRPIEGNCVILDSGYFKLTVKSDGQITSLIDSATRKEWIDQSATIPFASYQYDKYGSEDITQFTRDVVYRFYNWIVDDLGRVDYPECRHELFIPKCVKAETLETEDVCSLQLTFKGDEVSCKKYGNASSVIMVLDMPKYKKEINVRYRILDKAETPFIDAIHIAFPFSLQRPSFRLNKLGTIIDPAVDVETDANNRLYCIEDFIDVSDGLNSMAVVSYDVPLVSLQEQGIYQFGRQWQEKKPWLFFNVCNNAWGTNFPQWIGGNMDCSFTLLSHTGQVSMDTVYKAKSKRYAPITKIFDGQAGSLPANLSWFSFSEPVEILACYPANYHPGSLLLRIHTYAPYAHSITFKMNGLQSITPCDLQEEIIGECQYTSGSANLTLDPYGIHTYLLKLDDHK